LEGNVPSRDPASPGCVLALLSLGVGPGAPQQQAAVVTVVYDGVARPSLCDRQSFVFLSTVQGALLRSHTVDKTRSDPIDLVLVRRRLDSGQREEVRVPGLQPESSSDLELHCHQRITVIEESSISAHSRGVALDWPAAANQATLLTHFVDTPTARPATLLTELPPGSRSQLYLAGASRPLQDTDLERLKLMDRETGSQFGVIVAMPQALAYWPGSLVGIRSDASKSMRVGLNVHGESAASVVLFTGATNMPAAISDVPLEISGALASPTRATAASSSSPTLVSFSYDQREEGRIREIAGLAECDVGARAGHPIVTCTPIFRLALQWAKFNDMWVHRKIVLALDESGRHAIMADSSGQPADQTCIRFIDLPAPSGLSEASAACNAVVPGRVLDIAALSADRAALVIAFPGDPRRTDGIFRAVTVSRRRP
jgi:hypothetical protein